jgi:hypothetical protein
MKTKLFATVCFILNLLLIALDVFFIIDTFFHPLTSESYFLIFCFLLAIVFSAFLVILALKSYKAGIYYLGEILYNEEGRLALLPLLIFSLVAALGLTALVIFSLALAGFLPSLVMARVGEELLVATGALLPSTVSRFSRRLLIPLRFLLSKHKN